MTSIEPIGPEQRLQVVEATRECIARAEVIMRRNFTAIPVEFDLTGRAAGMYCVRQNKRWIRYNPYLFAKYLKENIKETIPHEVAHYIIDQVYGHFRVKPHGKEWRELMLSLDVNPRRTCDFDLSGIPQRKQNYHAYACECTDYQLTRRRHNKIVRDGIRYYCRHCRQVLLEKA